MASGLIAIDDKAVIDIEQVAGQLVEATTGTPSLRKSAVLSSGIGILSKRLDPLMDQIMAMQGLKLGFKTDRTYKREEVKNAVIEALCRGAFWVGNEFNIIGGSCYLTKEYFERKLAELPGLFNLRISEGVPQMIGEKGALVDMVATFVWQGQPDEIRCEKKGDSDTRICVRVNSGMGTDAILGKAKRKLYARVWNRCTGSKWVEADADDGGVVDGEVVNVSQSNQGHAVGTDGQ